MPGTDRAGAGDRHISTTSEAATGGSGLSPLGRGLGEGPRGVRVTQTLALNLHCSTLCWNFTLSVLHCQEEERFKASCGAFAVGTNTTVVKVRGKCYSQTGEGIIRLHGLRAGHVRGELCCLRWMSHCQPEIYVSELLLLSYKTDLPTTDCLPISSLATAGID